MGEFWIRAVAAAAIAYFCGCFNGAVIVSKYILRDDVRTHGSGNAGTTNALQRTTTAPRTATGRTTPSRRARRTRRTASPATGDKAAAANGIVRFFLRYAQTSGRFQ